MRFAQRELCAEPGGTALADVDASADEVERSTHERGQPDAQGAAAREYQIVIGGDGCDGSQWAGDDPGDDRRGERRTDIGQTGQRPVEVEARTIGRESGRATEPGSSLGDEGGVGPDGISGGRDRPL